MMNEPKRRYVTDLPEKLTFLATHAQVRLRHGLSMAALSVACGMSRSWLKSAKDISRGTRSIATEVARQLAELCHFDPSWPEWLDGSAAAFQRRCLGEEVGETRDERFFHRLNCGGDIAEHLQQKLLRCAEEFGALRTALRAQDSMIQTCAYCATTLSSPDILATWSGQKRF